MQSVRGAFEYQGQKCSALSRLYVPASQWDSGFKDLLLNEVAKLKVGPPQDWTNFIGPVMYVFPSRTLIFPKLMSIYYSGRPAYDKIIGYIEKAKAAGGEVLIGGTGRRNTAKLTKHISDVLV